MRIAFVSGNREKLPDAVIPLGLLYIMASTPERHERVLVDLCFERDPRRSLQDSLASIRPDLIALGMRNIQNNDYSGIEDNLDYYAGLIEACRSVSPAPVVLGGGGFSVMPRQLMQRLRPDYGISGEGEAAFPKLVEALAKGEEPGAAIGNLHRFCSGQLVSTPAEPKFLDMASLAAPDRTLLDPRYAQRYGIDSVQTKRGCPLRCDYCTYPLIEGRVGRVRTPAAVADEMALIREQQPETRHIFIVDSVFNLPRSHAKNVCRELVERDWDLPWTCYTNPLGFDRELAQLARNAGCAGMEVGSDGGSDEILERLRKGFGVAEITRLHELCLDEGIRDCHTFILGTRGETLDDVRRSLDFVADLDPFAAILMLWIDDAEALDPDLRRRHVALREQIGELLIERRRQQPQWIIPTLRINFDSRLFHRMRRAGMHGPLWQHIRGAIDSSASSAA